MRLAAVVLGAGLLAGCTSSGPAPFRPVTEAEALATVQRVVDLTAQGRFDDVCEDAVDACAGLSSSARRSPFAPGPDRPPAVRCTFGLPDHLRRAAWGDGRVVVLEGRDARDRPYVSQQLVVREDGPGEDPLVRVHEPAFWYGIVYRGFGGVRGAAWSAALGEGESAPSFVARQTATAVRSCEDTAGYLAEVAPEERAD